MSVKLEIKVKIVKLLEYIYEDELVDLEVDFILENTN